MKIVVIGASGYLARRTSLHLIDQGHDVIQYLRVKPSTRPSDALRIVPTTRDLPEAIIRDQPELVINMANVYTRPSNLDAVACLVDVNELLMSLVVEACLQTSTRLLHIGSAWQADLSAGSLGLGEAPVYSLHRGLASSIGRWYAMHQGLDFAEIAIADTYGPDDPRGKLINQMLSSAQTGATEFSLGSQDPTLYPVHVDDVARFVATAVMTPTPESRKPWLCAWEPGISASQLVTIINDLHGIDMVPKFGDRPPRPNLDLKTFAHLPGWEPIVSPREGLLLMGAG